MPRTRLDQELVRRGLFETRSSARNAIRDGQVTVAGVLADKPAQRVEGTTDIVVDDEKTGYVGRGALKLLQALDSFGLDVSGSAAVDVGASTGGFTQVLLEKGARSVAAIDVGSDQLHRVLRSDPQVDVWEQTNVRGIDVDAVGGPFDVVTVDLSFISLTSVAGDIERLGRKDADWVVLLKPQFEVGKAGLAKDGVVRDEQRRIGTFTLVSDAFSAVGLVIMDIARSPLPGGSGNVEALLHLRREGVPISSEAAFKVLRDE